MELDGAVVDKKEPSDALVEDPEAVAEPFIENPEAESRGTHYRIDCRCFM